MVKSEENEEARRLLFNPKDLHFSCEGGTPTHRLNQRGVREKIQIYMLAANLLWI